MHLTTIRGHSLLEYQAPEDWEQQSGIILPSAATMREYLRGRESKTFDVNAPPPDIYRWGKYVSGAIARELGDNRDTAFIYFNRHDAEEFEFDGKTYYRVNDANVLGYYVP